jgi:hypothetical protein
MKIIMQDIEVRKFCNSHFLDHIFPHIMTPFAWVKALPLSNLNLQMPSRSHSMRSALFWGIGPIFKGHVVFLDYLSLEDGTHVSS